MNSEGDFYKPLRKTANCNLLPFSLDKAYTLDMM